MIAVAQIDAQVENPTSGDLYATGTEVAVSRPLQMPDGSVSILLEGHRRVEIVRYLVVDGTLRAQARPVDEPKSHSTESMALMRAVLTLFERAVRLSRTMPEEAYVYAVNIEDPGWLADLVTSALTLTIAERQEMLETFDPMDRLQRLKFTLRTRA